MMPDKANEGYNYKLTVEVGADGSMQVRGSRAGALVHFLAQRKRFLWDRGCIYGLFRRCQGV
jgi:hypothetical protein